MVTHSHCALIHTTVLQFSKLSRSFSLLAPYVMGTGILSVYLGQGLCLHRLFHSHLWPAILSYIPAGALADAIMLPSCLSSPVHASLFPGTQASRRRQEVKVSSDGISPKHCHLRPEKNEPCLPLRRKERKVTEQSPINTCSVGIQLYHSLPAVYCPHTLDVTVLSVVDGVSTVICGFLHLGFL